MVCNIALVPSVLSLIRTRRYLPLSLFGKDILCTYIYIYDYLCMCVCIYLCMYIYICILYIIIIFLSITN